MARNLDRYQEFLEELDDCATCQVIWKLLNGKDTGHFVLADTEEGSEISCQRHRPICQAFWSECLEEVKVSGWPDDDPQRSIRLIGRDNEYRGIVGICDERGGFELKELVLAEQDGKNEDGIHRMGRKLDPDWVDMQQIRRWKTECLMEHGGLCEDHLASFKTRPRWVIDVETIAIVPGNAASTYVALSYVWGTAGQFRMTKKSMRSSRRQWGLRNLPIAPIIRRAMTLTRLIGERYLWVDALCIVQDGDDLSDELSDMGSIYASAVVVIVAADGDAQSGLAGIPRVSSPRQHGHRLVPFASEQILLMDGTLNESYEAVPYHIRGWTYQEFALARRRLIFVAGKVHWHCQCKDQVEDLNTSWKPQHYGITSDLQLCSKGFQDIESVDEIFKNYSGRHLTHSGDALPAIAGLLSIVSQTFAGGFLFGHAEACFEHSLCWWTFDGGRRRQNSWYNSDYVSSSSYRASIPSWSYLGWEGSCVEWGMNDRLHSDTGYRETYPITEWYTSATPRGNPRRRVGCQWYEARETCKRMARDSRAILPDGWTRHTARTECVETSLAAQVVQESDEVAIFRHDSLDQDDDRNLWLMPFPIVETTADTLPCLPPQTPYLFCDTQRGYLPFVQTRAIFGGLVLSLVNVAEQRIGDLSVDDEHEFVERLTQVDSYSKGLERQEVELVSICGHREYKRDTKPWFENTFEVWQAVPGLAFEGRDPIMMAESYYVLWIEWVDGIAYRLGSGQVEKSAWESLPLDTIEVCLG